MQNKICCLIRTKSYAVVQQAAYLWYLKTLSFNESQNNSETFCRFFKTV